MLLDKVSELLFRDLEQLSDKTNWQNRLTELLLLQVDGDVEAISKKQRFPQ